MRTDGGSASSVLQIEFAGQDYGKTHTFTIVARAEDQIDESDTSNNVVELAVHLPAQRPSGGFFNC